MYQSKWAPKPDIEEDKTPSSSLSASAAPFSPIPFSPAPPPPDVSTDHYFAQTGASQDDLFDGTTAVDNSMRVRSEDDLFSDDFTPAAQPVVESPTPPPRSRGRGDGVRGRGRGRGRGADAPSRGAAAVPTQPNIVPQNNQPPMTQEIAAPEDAPKGPRKEGVPSVRGDRQATGGLAKPKLTEEELAEKMARIQIKNASLTAAHARAEADAASFAQREEQAKQVSAQRQKEERKDRQQMMGERERNRMRKLKAMEGREWDAEKNDDDFQKGGQFDKKGNFAGDKEEYTDGREYLYREPRGGNRGSRGSGRGRQAPTQSAPKREDFPALPPSTSVAANSQGGSLDRDAVKSWADQVEAST